MTAFFDAVARGEVDLVTSLLSRRWWQFWKRVRGVNDQDGQGNTALHLAAAMNRGEVAELLVRLGAQINALNRDGHGALHVAVKSGHRNMVELLLNRGADVDANGGFAKHTPLHVAARKGNLGLVMLLLACGADVNAKTVGGVTPLAMAEEDGEGDVSEVVRHLIEKGGEGVIPCARCGGIRCLNCNKALRACTCGARVSFRPGEPSCRRCKGKR